MKLNSKQLRAVDELAVLSARDTLARKPLYLILDDLYDTYNIGGLFRLADALSVAKIYLCGETTPPPNNRIHKASCGTYKVVPWEYCGTTKEAIQKIQQNDTNSNQTQKTTVVAIEQSPTSVPYTTLSPSLPLALVVGNETTGISSETLKLCDAAIEIPMWGINKSLNVIVSAGIVAYHYISQTK